MTHKNIKKSEISCFEMLDGLKASPVTWTSFFHYFFREEKIFFQLKFFPIFDLKNPGPWPNQDPNLSKMLDSDPH
jgi:hypothetical protein